MYLESDEAARRLGVKQATLYAYVSRGLLDSYPAPDSRRRLFALEDVERLARRGRGGKQVESRLASVVTSVCELHPTLGPIYRGVPAAQLALQASFEEAAEMLWEAPGGAWDPLELQPPETMAIRDRLRWSVVMAAAQDPLRNHLRRDAITGAAGSLIATMALAAARGPARGSIASRLACGFCRHDPSPPVVRAVNGALVLLADHELAASTLAARIASSARADVYNVVLAGLGPLAGPLHGAAGVSALRLLVDAERVGAEAAINEALRWRQELPGFGHVVYRDGDPRWPVLFGLLAEVFEPGQRRIVESLLEVAERQRLAPPNVDFGLAVLIWSARMPSQACEALFAIARTAGWVAHMLEELQEQPLRFRARAVHARRAAARTTTSASSFST